MSERAWIPTADVRVGDQLAHKLSDTPWTYTRVTGWSDKTFSDGTVQRLFAVAGAPWWVDGADLWHSLDGKALVLHLGSKPEPRPVSICQRCGYVQIDTGTSDRQACPRCKYEPHPEPEPEPEPVTRVILSDDFRCYRMPVPSRYSNDLMASEDERWAVLESIGIGRRAGVSPLAAWRDAVADASGIPQASLDPAQSGVFDLGFTPAYVRTFVFYIA